MELITIEGTIEKIYENIDEYKKGLTPKAKEKGFGYLLDTKDGKIIIIADKDLLRLGLVRVGNYVKAIGWFKDKGIFLATMTVGNVDEEKSETFILIKRNQEIWSYIRILYVGTY